MQGTGDNHGLSHPLKRSEPRNATNNPVPPPSSYDGTRTPPHLRSAAPSASNSPIPPSGRPPRPNHKPTQSIDLQAVLSSGPHEMEAETHILRAVEKMTGQAHQRTGTETARLFATIAEDDITRALDDGDILEDDNDNNNNNNNNNNSPNTPDGTVGTDTETVTYIPGDNANTPTTTQPTPDAGKAKFKGLVQQTVEASKDSDVTIEETLFGFSNALNQMDQTSKHRGASVLGTYSAPLKGADKLAANLEEHIQEEILGNKTTSGGGGGGDVEQGSIALTEADSTAGAGMEAEDTHHNKAKRRHTQTTAGARKLVSKTAGGLRDDFELFNEFVGGKKKGAKAYAKTVVCFIMLPALVLSALLFYFGEQPEKDPVTGEQDASSSWWILYLGVRLPITLTMALLTQALVIDYLALGSRFSLKWFGPIITLFVVQSKGWPFVSIFWGAYNLILLAGDKPYVRHWFYWQDAIDLFNNNNPGGNVLNSDLNFTLMRLMITIGFFVSVKRLLVGLFLGRQTFAHFGPELATVMKNMVLVGAVATLAREIEKDSRYYARLAGTNDTSLSRSMSAGWAAPDTISNFVNKEADAALEEEEETARKNVKGPSAAAAASDFIKKRNSRELDPQQTQIPQVEKPDTNVNTPEGEFTNSEQVEISDLLEAWEEPVRAEDSEERKITIGAVMQFRQALSYMKKKYPFLPAFGPADTRERCIQSSQAVYDRLLMRTPNRDTVPFETLALLARDDKGGINQDKAKELIRIFRPERDGSLGKLEFVKSVDVVYKQMRLLSANISNSSQIDKAIESIVNIVFYAILGSYVISALGSNPSSIFFSFSSVILGFAFMFGASSAKYFEGLLFILVQRPYGVGDRIHLSNPQTETSPNGSSCWVVEKVTLNTTTVYWGTTNERATLCNGAIANLRVINAARSPNATVYVELKFAIDTPYEKIAIFRAAVEQFLKERPREWLTFVGFRPTEVAVDRGFIGYKIIAQHRNHWQGIGGILESKANLTQYSLEVAKQLDMRYHAPPLPVDLSMKGTAKSALEALHSAGSGGGLDQAKIAQALNANKSRRGPHEGFADD